MSLSDDIHQWKGPFKSPSAAELGDRLAASQLVKIYALGIDMHDYELCRSAFADGAEMIGSMGSGDVDDILRKTYDGAQNFMATQHNITNQHVTIDGDEALVWSYAIAVHKSKEGSGREDLTMGVQYRDKCRRFPNGWLIVQRRAVPQWAERTGLR